MDNPHADNPSLVPPDLPPPMIPAIFNRAGYATMPTCKTGNSYEAANRLSAVRRDARMVGSTDETGSAWHAGQVLDYLPEREAGKDTRPFLIYFGFSHPHDTRDGKPELLAKYGPPTTPTATVSRPRTRCHPACRPTTGRPIRFPTTSPTNATGPRSAARGSGATNARFATNPAANLPVAKTSIHRSTAG